MISRILAILAVSAMPKLIHDDEKHENNDDLMETDY